MTIPGPSDDAVQVRSRAVRRRALAFGVLGARRPGGVETFTNPWFGVESDALGSFEAVETRLEPVESITALQFGVLNDDGSGSRVEVATPPVAHAVGPLSRPMFELGDVVVPDAERAPLLASGRVEDESGRPVRGAALELRPPGEPSWFHTEARSGADGAFELRHPLVEGLFAVRARLDGNESRPSDELTIGSRNLVLRIVEKGTVFFRLLFPEELEDVDFELRAAEGEAFRLTSYESGDDGTFRLLVPPGRYELDISLDGRVVVPRVGVDVRAGRETQLGTFDLRETFHAFRVLVVDTNGAPLRLAGIAVFEDGALVAQTSTGDDGVAVFPSRTQKLDLAVGADDCRTRLVNGVEGGARVTLEPGIVVQFRSAEPLTALGSARVVVEVQYHGHDPRRFAYDSLEFQLDETGRGAAALPLVGVYDASFLLRGTSRYDARRITLPEPVHFEIGESGGEIVLPLTDAVVREAPEHRR